MTPGQNKLYIQLFKKFIFAVKLHTTEHVKEIARFIMFYSKYSKSY